VALRARRGREQHQACRWRRGKFPGGHSIHATCQIAQMRWIRAC
jgi:hypothetical protein